MLLSAECYEISYFMDVYTFDYSGARSYQSFTIIYLINQLSSNHCLKYQFAIYKYLRKMDTHPIEFNVHTCVCCRKCKQKTILTPCKQNWIDLMGILSHQKELVNFKQFLPEFCFISDTPLDFSFHLPFIEVNYHRAFFSNYHFNDNEKLQNSFEILSPVPIYLHMRINMFRLVRN